ncbi:MAG: hypothetical protein V3W04_03125 [Gammaproteobacteria bacterium]
MMKILSVMLMSALLLSTNVYADTVVEEIPDTLPGKGFGGLAGIMAGAAIGGPIGAVGAGLVSAWLGGEVQEITGLHGQAYRIESLDGDTNTVRSPRQKWSIGDKVQIVDGRLVDLQ